MSLLSRRDFLKLSGVGLGALAFNPFKPEKGHGDGYEKTPVIPNLFDLSTPIPRHPLLDTDFARSVLTYPKDLVITGHMNNRIESPLQHKWSKIAKKRLLRRDQISNHVIRTGPLEAIDAESIPELLAAQNQRASPEQIEQILLQTGICTLEQVLPDIVLTDENYSERARRLYLKAVEAELIHARACDLIAAYQSKGVDLLSPLSELEKAKNILELEEWTADFRVQMLSPVKDQLMIESCVPHGIFRGDVWPEYKNNETENVSGFFCYDFVATVINTLAVCRGRTDLSPVKVVDGRFQMKESYRGDHTYNMENLFNAMVFDSDRFGFCDITGSPYEQMLKEVEAGKIIIGVNLAEDEREPTHMYLLWGGRAEPGSPIELLMAETTRQPYSDLYVVVTEEENKDLLGYQRKDENSRRLISDPRKRFFTFDA